MGRPPFCFFGGWRLERRGWQTGCGVDAFANRFRVLCQIEEWTGGWLENGLLISRWG